MSSSGKGVTYTCPPLRPQRAHATQCLPKLAETIRSDTKTDATLAWAMTGHPLQPTCPCAEERHVSCCLGAAGQLQRMLPPAVCIAEAAMKS